MNFRPTLWKVVLSIIIAIIVFILTPIPFCKPGGECNSVLWPSLASLILTYVIWSLFQKRKKKVKNKK